MARWRHLISLADLSSEEISGLLSLAIRIKSERAEYRAALTGRTLGMVFQKRSTRTRISFEVGMLELGGAALFLSADDLQLGRGETVADTARVLSRYLDGVMARTNAHQDILDLAEYGTVPVINGLSDLLHPCQALADYLTLLEHFGSLQGLKLVYLGDGNNVAHSLLNGAAKLGVHAVVACPPGYEPDPKIVDAARRDGAATGAKIEICHDPREALRGAQAVYTDVWVSMGQEAEVERRKIELAAYQVNTDLFACAEPDAVFLHCLPAHRGEEVTDEVVDHERSLVFDQAENRLHAQKAVLLELL